MAIDTETKRRSSVNLFLPFGRAGVLPSGSNLGTVNKREAAAFGYALDAPLPAGANTSNKRRSAVNLHLPFNRAYPLGDSSDNGTAPERAQAAYGYYLNVGVSGFGYVITGGASSQPASCSGIVARAAGAPVVRPFPAVRSRTIGFDALVRMAEGDGYAARMQYPVYTFGGGTRRRIFTQTV